MDTTDESRQTALPAKWSQLITIWVVLMCVAPASLMGAGFAADPREVHRQLESTVGIRWENAEFGPALSRAAEAQRIALFMDRRFDPRREITAAYQDVRFRDVLADAVARQGGGLSVLESVVYVGPAAAAGRLRTLASIARDEARQLPAPRRRMLARPTALQWMRLDSPHDILRSICDTYHLEVANPLQMPHDLWNAGAFPPLRCSDQLSLILIGFDLKFEWERQGAAIRLVPVTFRETVASTYADNQKTSDAIAILEARGTRITTEQQAGKLVIRATVESHQRLRDQIAGRTPPDNSAGDLPDEDNHQAKRYTLKIAEQPLQVVLDVLSRRLHLEFDIDHDRISAAGISLDKRVSFEVDRATLDELLRAALEPVGLTFTRKQRSVRVEVRR